MSTELRDRILHVLSMDDIEEGETLPTSQTIDLAVSILDPLLETRPQPSVSSAYSGDLRFHWDRQNRHAMLAVLPDGRTFWYSSISVGNEIQGDEAMYDPSPEVLAAKIDWAVTETDWKPKPGDGYDEPKGWIKRQFFRLLRFLDRGYVPMGGTKGSRYWPRLIMLDAIPDAAHPKWIRPWMRPRLERVSFFIRIWLCNVGALRVRRDLRYTYSWGRWSRVWRGTWAEYHRYWRAEETDDREDGSY